MASAKKSRTEPRDPDVVRLLDLAASFSFEQLEQAREGLQELWEAKRTVRENENLRNNLVLLPELKGVEWVQKLSFGTISHDVHTHGDYHGSWTVDVPFQIGSTKLRLSASAEGDTNGDMPANVAIHCDQQRVFEWYGDNYEFMTTVMKDDPESLDVIAEHCDQEPEAFVPAFAVVIDRLISNALGKDAWISPMLQGKVFQKTLVDADSAMVKCA
eukprot:CAMPEP_0114541750 /NCGR_PEP_ID=MMETSP0114-20121206/1469_1 /TAXON_ID=31324 /ORGANISM="Goniomonas sp, Strain m" /LENGTH=214 /DNA_ID=CAMNT_0001726003 /DNA_START=53 /DNA_END=694 /DNA_ORIENTATION=-